MAGGAGLGPGAVAEGGCVGGLGGGRPQPIISIIVFVVNDVLALVLHIYVNVGVELGY